MSILAKMIYWTVKKCVIMYFKWIINDTACVRAENRETHHLTKTYKETAPPLLQSIISLRYYRYVSVNYCHNHKDCSVLISGLLFTIFSY